jgi:hypothetical protein
MDSYGYSISDMIAITMLKRIVMAVVSLRVSGKKIIFAASKNIKNNRR